MRSADPAAAVRAFVAAGRAARTIRPTSRAGRSSRSAASPTRTASLAAVRAGADAIGLNLVPGHAARAVARRGRRARPDRRDGARPPATGPLIVAITADAAARDSGRDRRRGRPRRRPAERRRAASRRSRRSAGRSGRSCICPPSRPADAAAAASPARRARPCLPRGRRRAAPPRHGRRPASGRHRASARRRALAAAVARELPVTLAGGLTRPTSPAALRDIPAVGVDVASGVECPREPGRAPDQGPVPRRAVRQARPRRARRPPERRRSGRRPSMPACSTPTAPVAGGWSATSAAATCPRR